MLVGGRLVLFSRPYEQSEESGFQVAGPTAGSDRASPGFGHASMQYQRTGLCELGRQRGKVHG